MLNRVFLSLGSFSLVMVQMRKPLVSLEFPYFVCKTYDFMIVQGEKHVVLQSDTVPKGGKFNLTIPEKYRCYKGTTMWYITKSE